MPQRNMSYQQANMGNGYPSMSYVTPAPSIHNYTSSSPSYQPFGSYSNTKGGADLMNLLKPKEIPKPEVIQHSSGHKPLEPFTMYSPTDQDDSLFEPIEPPKTKSRKNKVKKIEHYYLLMFSNVSISGKIRQKGKTITKVNGRTRIRILKTLRILIFDLLQFLKRVKSMWMINRLMITLVGHHNNQKGSVNQNLQEGIRIPNQWIQIHRTKV